MEGWLVEKKASKQDKSVQKACSAYRLYHNLFFFLADESAYIQKMKSIKENGPKMYLEKLLWGCINAYIHTIVG